MSIMISCIGSSSSSFTIVFSISSSIVSIV